MVVNLSDLKTKVRHPLRPFFKEFNLSQLAKALGCSTGYLHNILLGHAKASPELELKITALASDIQAAERSTHSKESK